MPQARLKGNYDQDRQKRITLGFALLLVSLVLPVRVIRWNWAQNYVEYRATQATGQDFTIIGELDIDLFSHLMIRAEIIRPSNASWAQFQNSAEIETFALRVDHYASIWSRPSWGASLFFK